MDKHEIEVFPFQEMIDLIQSNINACKKVLEFLEDENEIKYWKHILGLYKQILDILKIKKDWKLPYII